MTDIPEFDNAPQRRQWARDVLRHKADWGNVVTAASVIARARQIIREDAAQEPPANLSPRPVSADGRSTPVEFPPPFTGDIDRDPRLDFDYSQFNRIPPSRTTFRTRALAVLAFIGAWTSLLGFDAVINAMVNLRGLPARLGGAARAFGDAILSLFI